MGDGRLELVAIESSDPRYMAPAMDGLVEHVHRVRAIGSIAISMCQVALTRVDGMVTLWRTRAVDVAAAQLIVRESGGVVAFTAFDDPLGAPLDLEPHSPVVAARTPEALARLASIP
jgi:myo-inositol-1(or 4)-monophosphatase